MSAVFIDNFPIDATISQSHDQTATATKHPVERKKQDGGVTTVVATEHVILDPEEVELECVVSNHPLGQMADFRSLEDGKPTDNAFARMQEIYFTKKIVEIRTELRNYSDMVMVKISYPRKKTTGDGLYFTARFQNIDFVTNDRTFVPVASPSAAKKDSRGNKPGKKPPDAPADENANKRSSILWGLTH